MKTIEKLLQEYKIRFKETEEIDEGNYPFEAREFVGVGNALIGRNVEGIYTVKNGRGLVFYNGTWATAKITEKPRHWVVKKDEQHPMWARFKKWQCENNGIVGFDYLFYNKEHAFNDDLLYFKDHQYLTLDQWTELFLDRPKGGDWCLFWGVSTEMPVVDVLAYNTDKGFRTADGSLWKNCQKLSPELVDMLEKEISQI